MRRLLALMAGLAVVLVLIAAPASGRAPSPPPAGTDVDYQLGGALDVPAHVGIIVRDRTESPEPDRYNVCYVNGFQTQPDERRFWRQHKGLVLRRHGRPVVDEAWGEWLLDLRTSAKRATLARIMARWSAGCARKGYDAVEFDNLDSFTRSHGLLRRRHAIAYARLLVRGAHRLGLAAGQKNLADFDGREVGYDFAVAEECGRYRECADYVSHYGSLVLAIEYRRADFAWTCERYGDLLPVVLRDRALSRRGVREWC